MTKRILTGVKPTGTPHLGNYFGTLEPALRRSQEFDESFLFIANYHALNQIGDQATLEHNSLSIAATWLACGLDPTQTHLYLQSDIPEEIELATFLTSFTPKGWMNKAHAYKAATDKNAAASKPADDGINMGLYTYPILMAADILVFDADVVPVGKDQIQHVEIARDIAERVNHHYGQDLLVPPEYRVEENLAVIPGLDGRKMSKSYDNVIPVFATDEERQATINKVVTDSSGANEAKRVEESLIYQLYVLVTNDAQQAEFRKKLEGGMGWGEAKQELGSAMNSYFGEMTAKYNQLMAEPDDLRQILHDGAERARPIAQATMKRLREAAGII